MPKPARAAAQTLSNTTGGVTLSNGAYGGATHFFLPSANSVTNSSGNAVSGGMGQIWTLINQGTVDSSFSTGNGVYLNTGTVSNGGSYAGHAVASAAYVAGNLNGVSISNAGSVVNRGTIKGVTGLGVFIGAGTVTNYGMISGATRGVDFGDGGSLGNQGVITGAAAGGVLTGGASGFITNSGTIAGSGTYGVALAAAGAVTNTGMITGNGDGVTIIGGFGTVANSGSINGMVLQGVYLGAGGLITNNSGGRITSTGTAGIFLHGGGSVVNDAGGYVGGTKFGIDTPTTVANAVTLTNAGTITGGGTGATAVYLNGGGTVTNSGTINGSVGVMILGAAASVANSGLIQAAGTGAGSYGVQFRDTGGTFDNTLANSGTIIGGGGHDAVLLGAGNDRLILNAGYSFTGVVDGGSGTNALEIATGNLTLTNVNSEFQNFQNVTIDLGATAVNTGAVNLPAGATVTDSGILNNSGTLAVPGRFDVSGSLTNSGSFSGQVAASGTVGITNSGMMSDVSGPAIYSTKANLQITNIGTIISTGPLGAVAWSGGGTLVNGDSSHAAALISGANYGVELKAGGATITNAGTIMASNGPGVDMNAPGALANSGLIQGTPYGLLAGSGDSITNSGTIKDAGTAGVSLASGASLTNQAGGVISGTTGVAFTGTGASLTNYGTITGTGGTAIQFDAGNNDMTLGGSSALSGGIDGGGGAGQIGLVGTGTIASTIANFGAGSALFIAKGANWTASGNWTIASVTNNGTLQPGTAGSPLKLTGNFTQSSASVLRSILTAGGGASELEVTGTATLAGTVAVTEPLTLTAPVKYTILTASGGVSGTFSSVTGGTALLPATLSYDANDVYVTVAQAQLTGLANATANQAEVEGGYDTASKATPALVASSLGALNTLQAPALATNLERLAGENEADLSTVAILMGRQFINRFQDHAGHRTDNQGWDIWSSGFGQSGHVNGDGNSHRLNEGLAGGVIGAERSLSPNFNLGLLFGYGASHFDVAGGLGQGRADHLAFAGTGDYAAGPLYFTAILGGAEGRGTTLRDVSVPGATAIASAKSDDGEFLGAFEGGYRTGNSWGINLTPFAGLDFGSVTEEAFTETGGGALDLAAANRNTLSVQSELGARLSETLSLGMNPLTTDLKLGWGHEFSKTARLADPSFSGGSSFLVAGARVPGDSAVIGLGVAAAIMPDAVITLHYDGDLASRGESDAVSLGLRFIW
ncbi:MAG: autotransporter outer membrane beta-barrel domain-containing protein [Rhizomicrobium sp.]